MNHTTYNRQTKHVWLEIEQTWVTIQPFMEKGNQSYTCSKSLYIQVSAERRSIPIFTRAMYILDNT